MWKIRLTRWFPRLVLAALALALSPSAPCAMEYAVHSRDWAGAIAWLAGSDRRAAQEAIQLIQFRQSGLALVRLDASGQRPRGTLAAARLVSAWALAETVHALGAFSEPRHG